MSSSRPWRNGLLLAPVLIFCSLFLLAAQAKAGGVEALGECSSSRSVHPAADGSVYVVARTRDCERDSPVRQVLIKLGPDGMLAPGFAAGGVLELTGPGVGPVVDVYPVAAAVTVVTHAGVYRFGPDGSPDTGFGSGGFAAVDFGAGPPLTDHGVLASAVASDGSSLLFGRLSNISNTDAPYESRGVLAKLDPEGNPAPEFGVSGLAQSPLGESGGLALDESGRIYSAVGGGVVRFGSDGSVDTSYGPLGNGVAYVPDFFDATHLVGEASFLQVEPGGSATVGGTYLDCYARCFDAAFLLRLDAAGGVISMNGELRMAPQSADQTGRLTGAHPPQIYVDNSENARWSILNATGREVSSHATLAGANFTDITETAFGSSSIFVVGSAGSVSFCGSETCPRSIVVAKTDPDGDADLSWGTDRGMTILPGIECPLGERSTTSPDLLVRKRCRAAMPKSPFKAKIGSGSTRWPSARLVLRTPPFPSSAMSDNCTKFRATFRLPPELRVRASKRVEAAFRGKRILRKYVRVHGGTARISLGCRWPSSALVVAFPRGSLRPIAMRYRGRRLEFVATTEFQFRSGEFGFREQRSRVRPIKPKK